jgi:hypothetical protein
VLYITLASPLLNLKPNIKLTLALELSILTVLLIFYYAVRVSTTKIIFYNIKLNFLVVFIYKSGLDCQRTNQTIKN